MHYTAELTHHSSVAAMAWSGLVLSVAAPGVVWLTRRSPLWERLSLPAAVALPLLVLLHAWVVLGDLVHLMPTGAARFAEPVLLVAAVLFWVPVVARTRHRLSGPGRCLHLFLAAPLLDLPAVGVIATGYSAEGIAMIVGMLPLGIVAAVMTWSWVNGEERLATEADALALLGGER